MAKHGKRKDYSKQHFVPQSYTKPWCDPERPQGATVTPYVWVFDPDGSNPRRKAPSNLFTETDIYTIKGLDGGRDLRMEHGFQGLEDKFTRIRNLRFARREWPNPEEWAWVLGFVATIHFRTVAKRDFHRKQWGRIRAHMEEMQKDFESATPERRRAMASLPTLGATTGDKMGIEDVRKLEENPLHHMIASVVETVLPILAGMSIAVLQTDDDLGFVTTDDPCTWFDPEAYKLPPLYRSPALGSETIEITLPISPAQCLVLTHRPDLSGYFDVGERAVNELNRRHVAHCNMSFIARRNEVRPVWTEERALPPDAWENVQRQKKAASG